jgi:hypothetical protein
MRFPPSVIAKKKKNFVPISYDMIVYVMISSKITS